MRQRRRDFDTLTDEEVRLIQDRLNYRPRKRLGFKTPASSFFTLPLTSAHFALESAMSFTNNTNRIPVFLCFDANYAAFAAVATYSAHISTQSPLNFYWLSTTDCIEYAETVRNQLQRLGMEIELISLDISKIKDWKTGHHFTTANYLRLFAPNLLERESRAIYLDCDTLVLTDLSNLYNTDLSGASFAGVIDEGGGATSKVPRASNDKYINSGVLLMDLDALRRDDFPSAAKAIYKQYEQEITWVDQCLINKYAEGQKVILDPTWNRQIASQITKENEFSALANPQTSSILHFVGRIKPWQDWCNPAIANFWWKYAKELKIEGLQPVPITTIEQVMSLADVVHMNGHYEESSSIKSNVIQELLKHLNELRSK